MPRKTTRRRELGGNFIRTIKLILRDRPGQLAKVTEAIASNGCLLGEVRIERRDKKFIIRKITIFAPDEKSAERAISGVSEIKGVRIVSIINEVMESHRGGKVRMQSSEPVDSMGQFRKVAFPGVMEACRAIESDDTLASEFTIAGRTVGIISNGHDLLGLGKVKSRAALPYVEGLAALMSSLADISAMPLVTDEMEVHGFIKLVRHISPTFAGIVLGGIGQPEISEISEGLEDSLPVPLFFTGRHGTAVSALAVIYRSAVKLDKKAEEMKIVVHGVSEAACSTVELLKAAGFEKITAVDDNGALYEGREEEMPAHLARVASTTNFTRIEGSLSSVIKGAEVYVGFAGGNSLSRSDIKSMSDYPIVLALGEPEPDISHRTAYEAGAFIAADRKIITICHGLCGIIKGAVEAKVKKVSDEMCIAAARKLAELSETHRDPLLPVTDREMHAEIAAAVVKASQTR